MKISEVEIQNTKSFLKAKIHFSEFLNVITGKSDSGKSALIKCLLFVIRNKAGRNIRTKNIDEPSFVSVSNGKEAVRRTRSSKGNFYDTDFGDHGSQFTAIKSDIPHEVAKMLNLTEHNIQEQKDPFFLIDESPGAVSKALNEVSGLSEIDRTKKAITTKINDIASAIRETNNSITKDKSKIESTEWSIQAGVELKSIEKEEQILGNLLSEFTAVISLVDSYDFFVEKLSEFLPESIISDYKEIETENKLSIFDETNKLVILNMVNRYSDLKKKYSNFEIIDMTELDALQSKIVQLTSDIRTSKLLLDRYLESVQKVNSVVVLLTATQKKLEEIPRCPTCLRPM